MSTPDPKPAETPGAAALPKKPSPIGGALRIVIPALLAAGASYGAARVAGAHSPPPQVIVIEHKAAARPPGPTVALDPFLVTLQDAGKKGHAMKMSLAVEFAHNPEGAAGGGGHGEKGGDDELKPFAPRIRDAVLAYVRGLTYEEASNGAMTEKIRAELLERCQKAGAANAERVLITDFVIQ